MKLWQQVSVLGLSCAVAANSLAAVVVDDYELESLEVSGEGSYQEDDARVYYKYDVEIEEDEEEQESFFDDMIPVFAGRVGLAEAQIGEDQDVGVNPVYPDRYKYTGNNSTQFLWGLFFGVDIPLTEDRVWIWETGLAYYRPNKFKAEGVEYRLGELDKADRNFEYNLQSNQLLWENKLLLGINKHFALYVLGAFGGAQNKTENYHSRLNDPKANPGPQFAGKTVTSVSYAFGAGAEVYLLENFRLGAGYQFTDLGKIELGESNIPLTDSGENTLKNSSTPTNEFLVSLTYLFE